MTTSRLEDKMFDFEKNAEEFVNNFKAISKFVAVNHKQGGPDMAMFIKKMENQQSLYHKPQKAYPAEYRSSLGRINIKKQIGRRQP